MVTEIQIEQRLVKGIRKKGGVCLKFEPKGVRGYPDRIVLLPHGVKLFVELKKPGGRLAPIQARRHRELRLLGHEVYVLWSYEDVDYFLEAL